MEWTEMILPLASSFAIVTAAMPLFIGYFQMKNTDKRFEEKGQNGTMSKLALLQWAASYF